MLTIQHNYRMSSFSNGTLDWDINYREPIGTGNLPTSSYYRNITFWSDPASTLQRSNDTHNVNIDSGEIFRVKSQTRRIFLRLEYTCT